MFARYAALAFCLGALVLSGCRRAPAAGVERLALLPFENLGAPADYDWLSRGIPGTVAQQLAASQSLSPVVVPSRSAVAAADLTLTGYFSQTAGRLRVTAVVRDLRENKTARTIEVSGNPEGVLPLLARISREVAQHDVLAIGTSNEGALREYWTSSAAADTAQRVGHLRAAIAADPGFAWPYIGLAEVLLAGGDAASAGAEIARARNAAAGANPYDKARLAVLDASLRNDFAGRMAALQQLTATAPNSADAWRALGEAELLRKNYAGAVAAFERALRANTQDISTLNRMAYAHAFAGNLEEAKQALERYRSLAPDDANAIDSLGDVHFIAGRFVEAGKYYREAHVRNPALLAGGDLFRAALANWYAGKRAEADAAFAEFLEFRKSAGDGILPIREAVWEAATGRLPQARARLDGLLLRSGLPPEIRFLATVQRAIFSAGESNSTVRIDGKPGTPAAAGLAAVAAFVTQPDASPAEWQARASRAGLPALGYALLLHGHFREAAPIWERIYGATHPDVASDSRVMLAWAYDGAGRKQDAAKLLGIRPLPAQTAEPGLGYLTFLQDQRLRGVSR